MKKVTKLLVLALFIVATSFSATNNTFAALTHLELVATPLPAGTYKYNTQNVQAEAGVDGNWTSTGTTSKYMFFSLSLPSGIDQNVKCTDGSSPLIDTIGHQSEIIAANPDSPSDQNKAWASHSVSEDGTIYAIKPGGAGGGSGSSSDIGTSGGSSTFLNPMSLSTFFAGYSSGGEQIIMKGVMLHVRQDGTEYSVTTVKPKFYLGITCDIGATTFVPGDTNSIDTAKADANSPKTGASEVIAFVAGASLIFVGYEATRMFKKRKLKSSTSVK